MQEKFPENCKKLTSINEYLRVSYLPFFFFTCRLRKLMLTLTLFGYLITFLCVSVTV